MSTGCSPFKAVYVGQTRIILGVCGLSGVLFPLSALMHFMGRVLIALGASHASLQLVVVSLQLSKLLLVMSLHLRNMGLELLESIGICHDRWGRMITFKRGLESKTRLCANH